VAGGLEEVEQRQHWQQQQKTKESSSSASLFYRYKVTTGRLSVKTKVGYAYHINEFLAYYKVTDLAPLREYSPKVIKQMVKDYVLYLRDFRGYRENLSPFTYLLSLTSSILKGMMNTK
jgi:hypothetical protein